MMISSVGTIYLRPELLGFCRNNAAIEQNSGCSGFNVKTFTIQATQIQSNAKQNMAAPVSAESLSLLSKFPVDKAEKYLDTVVSSLCGQRGPSFDHYSKAWSLTEFWESNDAWRTFFGARSCLAEDPSSSDAVSLDFLPSGHQAAVRKVVKNRREDIDRYLLHQTDAIGGAVLADFDWSVRLVVGSDKVASLGVPLAQLSLALSRPGDPKHQEVSLEMGTAEVERLITALEAAHKAVLQFKT